MTAEQVWASIESPALRCQIVELVAVDSLRQLAEGWGFETEEEAREYIRGPLMTRVREEAGEQAAQFLELRCAERGI